MVREKKKTVVDPGPLGAKAPQILVEDIRKEVVNDLGDLVFSDFTRLEGFMEPGSNISADDLDKEIKRWDKRQKKKWDIISRYQDVPSLELENLVFMELKRVYLMVMRLDQMKKAEAKKK